MDRRAFMETLITLGLGSSVLTRPTGNATNEWVQQSWTSLMANPVTFDVDSSGTLFIAGMDEPNTRGDCLDLEVPKDVGGWLDLANQDWRAREIIARAYLDSTEIADLEPEDVSDDQLAAWFQSDPTNLDYCSTELDRWLADTDLDEWDYEEAARRSNTPQGAALRFWRDGPPDLDILGVEVVEGECPGSTFFAAVLRISIPEANDHASHAGIPVRFRDLGTT